MTTIILGIFEEGLVYAIMALGVYITYRILDFPDLSVDGTFPLGAAFTATGRCALTAQNQQQGSGGPDKDTDYLFSGDRFFQVECRNNHSDDRCCCRDYGGIDRRGQGNAEDE